MQDQHIEVTSSMPADANLFGLGQFIGSFLGSPLDIGTAAVQDQYIELTSSIPSDAILFGLGEFTSNTGFPLRRDGLPYTLWTRDQPPAVPNTNLYGYHPIILDVRDSECF